MSKTTKEDILIVALRLFLQKMRIRQPLSRNTLEYEYNFKIKCLTSYLKVTIITSDRKVTCNVIRQTQRRSAYYLI